MQVQAPVAVDDAQSEDDTSQQRTQAACHAGQQGCSGLLVLVNQAQMFSDPTRRDWGSDVQCKHNTKTAQLALS
jgi:hypothetical protein